MWCLGVNRKQIFNIKSSLTFWVPEENKKNSFESISFILCTDDYDLICKYINERYKTRLLTWRRKKRLLML